VISKQSQSLTLVSIIRSVHSFSDRSAVLGVFEHGFGRGDTKQQALLQQFRQEFYKAGFVHCNQLSLSSTTFAQYL
jgi:hypothetical protein